MTARRSNGHRARCPVCGSRKLIPSLGRLAHPDDGARAVGEGEHVVHTMPTFSWRCRVCRTSMRAAHTPIWRRRKPLTNWLGRDAGRVAGV